MKRLIRRFFRKVLIKKGFTTYAAVRCLAEFKKDFFQDNGLSIKEKIWAYNKGFLSDRIYRYGLTEDNYLNFMPDYYWKLHPINGPNSTWIDDKLKIKYILNRYNDYLPKYFYQLNKGNQKNFWTALTVTMLISMEL